MINKIKYRKLNEKKVLHKVKKQWIIVGTAALSLLAVDAAPQLLNHSEIEAKADTVQSSAGSTSSSAATSAVASTNSSASATTVNASASSTASSESASSTVASTTSNTDSTVASAASSSSDSSNNSASASSVGSSATASADVSDNTTGNIENRMGTTQSSSSATNISLTATQPTANQLSVTTIDSGTNSAASIGFSISGASNATYHGNVSLSNYGNFGAPYVVQYVNSSGVAPLTGIKNLVQYYKAADGTVQSSAVDASAYSSLTPNVASTSSTPAGISEVNNSAVTSYALLTIQSGPFDSAANNTYTANDQIWWTYDIISNPDYKGDVDHYNAVGVTAKNLTPVKVNYLDSSTSSAVSVSQWITGDNIYPGSSYQLSVSAPSGYNVATANTTIGGTLSISNNTVQVSGAVFDNYTNPAINVYLTKNVSTQSGSISFLDADNKNSSLGGETFSGQVGDQVNYDIQSAINSLQAKGYQLASASQSVPSGTIITINNGNNDYTYKFTHVIKQYSASDTNLPSNINPSDLQMTVSRTINFVDGSTNQPLTKPSVQTFTYNRVASYDLAANTVTYSDWKVANNGNPQFAAVTAPVIDGYVAGTTNYPAVSVNVNSGTQTLIDYYTKASSNNTNNAYALYNYNSTNLPAGFSRSNLVMTVNQNVNVMNSSNVSTGTITVPVRFTRTAVYQGDKFLGYVSDGTTSVSGDTKYSDNSWSIDASSVSQQDLLNRMGVAASYVSSDNDWNYIISQILNQARFNASVGNNSAASAAISVKFNDANANNSTNATNTNNATSTTTNTATTSTSTATTTSTTTSTSATTTQASGSSVATSSTTSASNVTSTSSTSNATSTTSNDESGSSVTTNGGTTDTTNSNGDNTATSSTDSATNDDSSDSNATNDDTNTSNNDDTNDQVTSLNGTSRSSKQSGSHSTITNLNNADSLNNASTNSVSKSVRSANQKDQLPQTSENPSDAETLLAGMIAIVFAGIFGTLYRRQRH
ncbi:mucin-binding protein [Nicoliella lavandulae]|uniref:Gram-positive cocci surface proteins LPxTG domain-containing protein n=1 Tax=Nicoliella lavandulae TaxID=3082954 RepID=A0ABU8SM34_9LACO